MISLIWASFILVAPIPTIDPAALKKEQDAAWKDLASRDDKVATRALLKLSNRPVETVKFLNGAMKPLKIDEDSVKKLIADLASSDENVWKPAFETFEYFDPRLATTLQKCFDDSTPGSCRQRMVAVLCDVAANSYEGQNVTLHSTGDDSYNFRSNNTSWWAEHKVGRLSGTRWGTSKRYWGRAERAIVLLEHIGTKDAIAVLKSMATGHAEAGPTVAAKESLKRLKAE